MAYRLASERVEVAIDDGPTVEVATIVAWPLMANAVRLLGVFLAAQGQGAELAVLLEMYRFFVSEAQPSWDIADHRGPIPPTADGMLRLPLPIAIGMVEGWIETFAAEDATTAVDELVPPSPLRDQLNDVLKRKRKAA